MPVVTPLIAAPTLLVIVTTPHVPDNQQPVGIGGGSTSWIAAGVPVKVPELTIVLVPKPAICTAGPSATMIDPLVLIVAVSPSATKHVVVLAPWTGLAGHGWANTVDACMPAPATAMAWLNNLSRQLARSTATGRAPIFLVVLVKRTAVRSGGNDAE